MGAYEHPGRVIPDLTVPELHADVAIAALDDAGLTLSDVDAYYCADDAPGLGPMSMTDYLGIGPRIFNSTDIGGAAPVYGVGEAARAIEAGECSVALVTSGGLPRQVPGRMPAPVDAEAPPEAWWEPTPHVPLAAWYALCAQRHMFEFGTTSRDLAEIKAASSWHASHNPNAFLPREVTIDEVLESPLICDPLHRLDCCVVTDGGGAVVVVSADIAASLERASVSVRGYGAALKGLGGGAVDLTYGGGVRSGADAFASAGVTPRDIHYASIYDSFTITVLMSLEDLGFCERGRGGWFVRDGALRAPHGVLPVNTDGGGLSSNHPAHRGGITKLVEAVRQLRGEAHPEVQVANCGLALAHASGGQLGARVGAATVVLERED